MSIFEVFCSHEWKIQTKTKLEPLMERMKKRGFKYNENAKFSTREMENLTTPQVEVLLSCKHCGKIEQRTLSGEEWNED